MPNRFPRLSKTGNELREELKTRSVTYLLAAFGFVAGLAWNDAMLALIDYFFPAERNSLLAKWIYAIFITLLIVIGGYCLNKWIEKTAKKSNSGKMKKK